MSAPGASESLYGSEPPPVPGQAPGLLEQVVGVFTEPVALFKRLAVTPVWAGALALLSAANLVVTVIWAKRVDMDAMIRPMLERNPRIRPEDYDRIIEMQGKFTLPFGILFAIIGLGVVCLITALLYWLVGKWTAEDQPPSYRHAYAATVVSSLVSLPKALLLAVVCALRNLGGARPDALSPTALGFYVVPEGIKLQALFNSLDLFNFAAMVMLFLAARHTLRLKVSGAALCAALLAVLMIGLPALFAR